MDQYRENVRLGLLLFGIIAIVGGTLFSLFTLYVTHGYLYNSLPYWFMVIPDQAFLMHYTAYAWAGMVCLGYLIVTNWMDERGVLRPGLAGTVAAVLFSFSFVIFYFSLEHHYYADMEGITYKPAFSLGEEYIAWDEIVEMQPVANEGHFELYYEFFVFKMEDGSTFRLESSEAFLEYRRNVYQIIRHHGGEVNRYIRIEEYQG
ncbi:hypothetical protein [Alteribacter natronophilus]|uniref:hypothetical protein n=1 Tax=Alteribacter natronophilus TaxID=2583810 RepID=UPI00110F2A86|nr:hypothetical protein [Alteribacter natronophilus]TMW73927.1 hypothetical protein FGB90_06550 [Alteribacter natronophilus]